MVYTSQLTSESPQTTFFCIPLANTAFLTISHTLSFPWECYDLARGPSVHSCAFAQTLCLSRTFPGTCSFQSWDVVSVVFKVQPRTGLKLILLSSWDKGSRIHHSTSSSVSSALLWLVLHGGRGEERIGHQPGIQICLMFAGIFTCFPDRHPGNPSAMSTTQFLLQNRIPWKSPIETGGPV